jgi:hypothetical protein
MSQPLAAEALQRREHKRSNLIANWLKLDLRERASPEIYREDKAK